MAFDGRRGKRSRQEEGGSRREQLHTLAERVGKLERKTNRLTDRFDKKLGGDTTFVQWVGREVVLMDTTLGTHTGILAWVGKYHLGVKLYGEESEPVAFVKGNLIKVEPKVE
jgi:hypothetical protein